MQHITEVKRSSKKTKKYGKRARYSATYCNGVIPMPDTCFHSFEMNVYSPRVI